MGQLETMDQPTLVSTIHCAAGVGVLALTGDHEGICGQGSGDHIMMKMKIFIIIIQCFGDLSMIMVITIVMMMMLSWMKWEERLH